MRTADITSEVTVYETASKIRIDNLKWVKKNFNFNPNGPFPQTAQIKHNKEKAPSMQLLPQD